MVGGRFCEPNHFCEQAPRFLCGLVNGLLLTSSFFAHVLADVQFGGGRGGGGGGSAMDFASLQPSVGATSLFCFSVVGRCVWSCCCSMSTEGALAPRLVCMCVWSAGATLSKPARGYLGAGVDGRVFSVRVRGGSNDDVQPKPGAAVVWWKGASVKFTHHSTPLPSPITAPLSLSPRPHKSLSAYGCVRVDGARARAVCGFCCRCLYLALANLNKLLWLTSTHHVLPRCPCGWCRA
jgi:hypothetical protein